MPSWVNLPNLLTLFRLLLTPVVVYEILAGHYWLGGWLFGAAAFTDILDGAAARGMHVTTPVGAYLDPIADKCLLGGVFLALAGARIVPWWLVALILGRDLYILAGAAIAMRWTTIRSFPPSIWGKLSTFVQIMTVVLWIARTIFQAPVLHEFSSLSLWLCVAFTVWSGVDYTRRAILAHRNIDAVRAWE